MLITDILSFINDVKSCIKGHYVRRQITLMNDCRHLILSLIEDKGFATPPPLPI